MHIIPRFLLEKSYIKGSLGQLQNCITFELKNIFAPGAIISVNSIKINDKIYDASLITVIKSNEKIPAIDITPKKPIFFTLNQKGTCILKGTEGLKDGLNKIIIDITAKGIGQVNFTLTDVI